MDDLFYKIINYNSDEYTEAVSMREEVLRKPMGLRYTEEELLSEKGLVHLGIYDGTELIAAAALSVDKGVCHLQRVAVRLERQNQSLGTKLLAYVEREALERGAYVINCFSRDTAVNFYLKNGYILREEFLMKFGRAHPKMSKFLSGTN